MDLHKYDKCEHKIATIKEDNLVYQECQVCGEVLNVLYLRDLNDDYQLWDEDLLGI